MFFVLLGYLCFGFSTDVHCDLREGTGEKPLNRVVMKKEEGLSDEEITNTSSSGPSGDPTPDLNGYGPQRVWFGTESKYRC